MNEMNVHFIPFNEKDIEDCPFMCNTCPDKGLYFVSNKNYLTDTEAYLIKNSVFTECEDKKLLSECLELKNVFFSKEKADLMARQKRLKDYRLKSRGK